MVYVVHKARRELHYALLEADIASMNDSSHYLHNAMPDTKGSLTSLIA